VFAFYKQRKNHRLEDAQKTKVQKRVRAKPITHLKSDILVFLP
jgi:hypothetical protein